MVMPPHTNRGTSFAGPRLRLGRRVPSEPTCGTAVTEVLATLPTGTFVSAETVQSMLAAEGRRWPVNTVYKTMRRMSASLGPVRHHPGGFAIVHPLGSHVTA